MMYDEVLASAREAVAAASRPFNVRAREIARAMEWADSEGRRNLLRQLADNDADRHRCVGPLIKHYAAMLASLPLPPRMMALTELGASPEPHR